MSRPSFPARVATMIHRFHRSAAIPGPAQAGLPSSVAPNRQTAGSKIAPGKLLRSWAAASFTLDSRSLAVYRIGLGLLLLVDSLLRTRDFTLMFTPEGMFPLDAVKAYYNDPTNWSILFVRDAGWWAAAVLATQGVAGIALALGVRTRVATIVGWLALVSVIRRTAPATNAGDMWLACQLFWSMFLPLGSRWSVDARRQACRTEPQSDQAVAGQPAAVRSIASAALVFQLAAVYAGAGLAKCNATWFEGDAVTHALSVHDHGTALGMLLGQFTDLAWCAKWAVLGGEIALPIMLLAAPFPRCRGGIVLTFISFHVVIWLTMSVGLFAPIGMVAWLPLIPANWWPVPARQPRPHVARLGTFGTLACGLAGSLALVSFAHQVTPWRHSSLPRWLEAPLNVAALPQVWAMFGAVPPQEQWVYSKAHLVDGAVVDILRNGRPVETIRPEGGFTSLPHHRWHKFFWILPWPQTSMFAEPAAAALAREWNGRAPPSRQIEWLEIHFGAQAMGTGDAAIRDTMIASWPARSPAGSGNLDRFLQANARLEQSASQSPRPTADRPPTPDHSRPASSLTLLPPPR